MRTSLVAIAAAAALFAAACQFQVTSVDDCTDCETPDALENPPDAPANAADAPAGTADSLPARPDAAPDASYTPADAAPTTNDLPEGAEDISAGGRFTGSFADAHDDVITGCAPSGSRDLFYQLTLSTAEAIYFDTFDSDFDTVLALYRDPCTAVGDADQAAVCVDNGCQGSNKSQLVYSATAGTYCLVVEKKAGMGQSLVLRFLHGGRAGTVLSGGAAEISSNNCGQPHLTAPTCVSGASAPEQSFFFAVCPGTRSVNADTCGLSGTLDSILYLRGVSTGSVDLACNDDGCRDGDSDPDPGSRISRTITGPDLFVLTVDGWGGSCGPYTLRTML